MASTISVPSVSGEPPGPLLPSSSFEFSFFCVFNNHLVDFPHDGRRQPLSEVDHQGGVEGQLVFVLRKAAEILEIWVFLDHLGGFLIRESVFQLDDQCPKARCSGFATLPLLLANSFAYFSSICSQGMASAFLIQRLSGFISIPTGWPKSEKLICLLLNLYIVHLLVQAFSLKSEVFYTLIIR